MSPEAMRTHDLSLARLDAHLATLASIRTAYLRYRQAMALWCQGKDCSRYLGAFYRSSREIQDVAVFYYVAQHGEPLPGVPGVALDPQQMKRMTYEETCGGQEIDGSPTSSPAPGSHGWDGWRAGR